MKALRCYVLSILYILVAVSYADTWIDYPWPGEIKRSSSSTSFGFISDILGRRITAIQLRYSHGGLLCPNGETAYWGCRSRTNASIIYARVQVQSNPIAPSDADPRATASGAGYVIEGVSVTDSSLFMLTDWVATSTDLRVAFPSSANSFISSGTVSFFLSIRVDSFYTLASPVTLNSAAQTSAGDFTVAAEYSGMRATRFRFVHLQGTVACSSAQEINWNTNWGCPANPGASFCYEVFNTSVATNFNFSNIIVPSIVDPRITNRTTNPIGFYFKLSNHATDQSGLNATSMELETDVILSNTTTYSLQFCEMEGWPFVNDNVGSTTVSIQASFERWELIGNVTILTGRTNAPVPIPVNMVGQTLAYVRILHKSGTFACGHRWGCFDNSTSQKVNEMFYLSFSNATATLFPLADTRGIVMTNSSDGYKYLGYHLDDDSLIFELNTTITQDMTISIMSASPRTQDLDYAVYFTILPYSKFPECDPKSGFNEYTGGYSYVWCGICRWGYEGPGLNGSCTDINECGRDSNLCGKNARCYNLPGTYNCTCNPNFVGNPNVGCVSCGNGLCDTNIGEHCGNCPRDCPDTPCGVCGDGVCEAGREDCKSCYDDCGACVDPAIKCPGTPECSGQGSCRAGLCSCIANYSGPACDQVVQPINIVKNDSTPDITFTPATSQDILFQFAVYELREVNSNQNTVASVKLDEAEFTVTTSNVTNANTPTYKLTATLKNKASIAILIWIFTENTDMNFVNETLSFTANSIKFDVELRSWPFESLSNKLWMMTSQKAPPAGAVAGCGDDKKGIDGSGNLRFSQIQIGTTVLYGRFLEYAAIDQRKRILEVKAIEQTPSNVVVAIVIPSFFESAIIDPDLSVLIANEDKRECDENRNKKNDIPRTAIIAVCATVVGVAIIGAIIFLLFKKNIRKRLRRQTKSSMDGL